MATRKIRIDGLGMLTVIETRTGLRTGRLDLTVARSRACGWGRPSEAGEREHEQWAETREQIAYLAWVHGLACVQVDAGSRAGAQGPARWTVAMIDA